VQLQPAGEAPALRKLGANISGYCSPPAGSRRYESLALRKLGGGGQRYGRLI
jgi:hypothetical protein